jgi:hypothetical protein
MVAGWSAGATSVGTRSSQLNSAVERRTIGGSRVHRRRGAQVRCAASWPSAPRATGDGKERRWHLASFIS